MSSLTLRAACIDDAQLIWLWRNSKQAYRYYKNPHRQTLQEHTLWMNTAIKDQKKYLWMIEDGEAPLSHVRVDVISKGVVSTSIVVDPKKTGKGIGARSLQLTLDWLASRSESVSVYAEVHADNIASRKLFEAAGFEPRSQCHPFLNYALLLPGKTDNIQTL